jgi:hypothetical protein
VPEAASGGILKDQTSTSEYLPSEHILQGRSRRPLSQVCGVGVGVECNKAGVPSEAAALMTLMQRVIGVRFGGVFNAVDDVV